MEIPIIAGLVGFGYYLNKDGITRERDSDRNEESFYKNEHKKYLAKDDPNGNNIYESMKSYKIRNCEQEASNNLYALAGDPIKTNVITPGQPQPIINKISTKYSNTKKV